MPLIKIAKIYMELGGKVIFFSHGGKFEYLVKKINSELVSLGEMWKYYQKKIDELKRKKKFEKIPFEKLLFLAFKKDMIENFVEEEIIAFKKTDVKMIISSFNPTTSISARVLKIPLVVLASGTSTSLFCRSGFATYPENYENALTKIIPIHFKNKIAQFIYLNNKLCVKDFNIVSKKYGIKKFHTLNDTLLGDFNLICDDINFLGVKPDKDFPLESFIGPITGAISVKQKNRIDEDIKKHLERPGRSILFMMGTTRNDKLFLDIINIFNDTDYNFIVVYTGIDEDRLPKVRENILLKKFIDQPIEVNKMVDLAIIHGGRGTIYNAAYSGKPIIGIPMYIEHQYNIDCLVRKGVGLRVSMKFFKKEELLNGIEKIFSEYNIFLKNAQNLSKIITKQSGEEKAVKRIIEISNKII